MQQQNEDRVRGKQMLIDVLSGVGFNKKNMKILILVYALLSTWGYLSLQDSNK